ncbi:MAG: hypothetical protein PVJ57_13160 [Phycisphaerae bacterium]|jgi:hypothetical protein
MDVNADPTANDDCDPDAGVDADRRYYYSQDRNWNVVTLYESDDGSGTAGRVREYYAYTPYGEFTVLGGDAGSGLQISAGGVSGVGNALGEGDTPLFR